MNELEKIDRFKEIEPFLDSYYAYPKIEFGPEIIKILGPKYEPHEGYRLTLKNGYQISMIKGFGTHAGPGTVECAVFTPEGEWYLEEQVMDYVTEDEFVILVQTIGSLRKEIGGGDSPA